MILLEDVLKLHKLSIDDYGGAHGIRDFGLLESAIARPFQTFGGEELYISALEKAAAITESIIISHPFIDGNKRTGILCLLSVLYEYNIALNVQPSKLYDFAIGISTGEIKFEAIVNWLKDNTTPF